MPQSRTKLTGVNAGDSVVRSAAIVRVTTLTVLTKTPDFSAPKFFKARATELVPSKRSPSRRNATVTPLIFIPTILGSSFQRGSSCFLGFPYLSIVVTMTPLV